MSNIKIAVACHKPSELPNNSIYYPVQVGAAIAKKKLGLQGDNTGDNISEKNETYCELTAQYWAWKNLDADYYGLCHYRRFLCLMDKSFPNDNERQQIEANVLNDFTQKMYGISDEEGSKAFIEKYDVIVGRQQNVSKLFTPLGQQDTAWKHWTAHDGYLINQDDLKYVIHMLCKKYPEIGEATKRYLSGKNFLGFNCFVMKKKYFQEMCEMEFDILADLEKHIDRSKYNQQLNRVYGFMAEILFSGYVAYLQEKKLAKVKNTQLVYFNETDPVENFYPNPIGLDNSETTAERVVPVLYKQGGDMPASMLALGLKSVIDHASEKNYYDLLVLCRKDFNNYYKGKIAEYIKGHNNISVRYLRQEYYELEQKDQNIHNVCIDIIIPQILKNYDEVAMLANGIILNRDVADLYDEEVNQDKYIAAPLDLLGQARINYGDPSEKNHLKMVGMKDPYNFCTLNTAHINLAALRKNIDMQAIVDRFQRDASKKVFQHDIVNQAIEGHVNFISSKWMYTPNTSDYLAMMLPQMPFTLYKEYQATNIDNAFGVKILLTDIAGLPGLENTFVDRMFEHAKELGIYEIVFRQLLNGEYVPRISNKLDSYFPANSWQTNLAYKLLPVGTERYEKVREMLVKMKMIR